MADIQFVRGVNEEVVPDVKITRAKDGGSGRAVFYFDNPIVVQEGNLELMGMYMIDEEGELISREVNAKFINGKPVALETVYNMRSTEEWERFIRFMDRYAETHGLGLNQP